MKSILMVLSAICVLLVLSFSAKDVIALEYLGALMNIANNDLNYGRYQEATIYYDKILRIDPNNIIALLGKGIALNQLHKYNEAIPYLDKALKIYPNNSYVLHYEAEALLGEAYTLYQLHKYNEAIPYLDKALKIYPPNVIAMYGKAVTLSALGKYHDALFYYEQILKIAPKFPLTETDLKIIHGQYSDSSHTEKLPHN